MIDLFHNYLLFSRANLLQSQKGSKKSRDPLDHGFFRCASQGFPEPAALPAARHTSRLRTPICGASFGDALVFPRPALFPIGARRCPDVFLEHRGHVTAAAEAELLLDDVYGQVGVREQGLRLLPPVQEGHGLSPALFQIHPSVISVQK